MAFSNETVGQAWKRAGGRCECKRLLHFHPNRRCNKDLAWENRGKREKRGCWEAHHITAVDSGGDDSLSNCEILCCECHDRTL